MTRPAPQAHSDTDDRTAPSWTVGDLVTVGAGKTVWRIAELWSGAGEPMARLASTTGYTTTSAPVTRLKAVAQ